MGEANQSEEHAVNTQWPPKSATELRNRITELEAALADATEHPKTVLACVTCQKVAVVENCALTAENERLQEDIENRKMRSCDSRDWPPNFGIINDVVPPDRVEDGDE